MVLSANRNIWNEMSHCRKLWTNFFTAAPGRLSDTGVSWGLLATPVLSELTLKCQSIMYGGFTLLPLLILWNTLFAHLTVITTAWCLSGRMLLLFCSRCPFSSAYSHRRHDKPEQSLLPRSTHQDSTNTNLTEMCFRQVHFQLPVLSEYLKTFFFSNITECAFLS